MSGVKQLQKPLQRFKGKPDDKLKAGEPRKSMEALKPVLRRIKEKSPIEAGLNSMDGALSYEGIDNCILSQIIEGDLQNHIPLLVSEKKIRMKDLPLKLKSFKEMDIKEKLNSPKYGKQLSTLVHKSEKN